MLAKKKIVFYVSQLGIICQKTTCLVQNRIIRAKMIYVNTKIKNTYATIPHRSSGSLLK